MCVSEKSRKICKKINVYLSIAELLHGANGESTLKSPSTVRSFWYQVKKTENEKCDDLDIHLVSNPKPERRIEFTGEVYRVRGLTEMMKKTLTR